MVDNDASNSGERDDILNVMNEELHDHPDMSERLKDDCVLPLWPGCTKFSKLSDVLTLYNLKVGHQFSDVFFTAMLTAHNDLTDRILHGVPLEEEFVRVLFEVAEKLECNAPLPRPCDEANLVGQAPGFFLACPRKLVSTKLEKPPKIMEKKTNKHDMGQKKLQDKQKEKTVESMVA
ncbi:hypothetical protein POM88_013546 [Heracleum sosnowskyi]|uniref:Uncharacterized protein n=1 Tax=Heracleum sosnowskyi TaxID=360622 RepID=A0AAD8IYS4_9APIA|nr:hypothetical protein POM88_013546 [Heracleum sosnowskyi]